MKKVTLWEKETGAAKAFYHVDAAEALRHGYTDVNPKSVKQQADDGEDNGEGDDNTSHTMRQLKAMAREAGVDGYKKMGREELEAAMAEMEKTE